MGIKKRILEIYQDENNKEPYTKWIDSLKDITIKARIENRLRRIELGNFGDSKSVGDGVLEFRFAFGAGYRVYFGEDGNNIVILLCGGDKKTQKKDIKKAKEYWNDYKKYKEAQNEKIKKI